MEKDKDSEEPKTNSFLKDKLNYFKDFAILVAIYGLIINYALNQLIGIEFSIGKIIGIGIIAYLLKYEVPILIKSSIK